MSENLTPPILPNNDDSNSEGSGDGVVDSQQALLHKHDKRARLIESIDPTEVMVKINGHPKDPEEVEDGISTRRKYLSVGVLFLINLLNYMDRFNVAGVLLQIQNYFEISNAAAGFVQTVFIISYMLVAPLFGYLGDRFDRKLVMLVGMVVWSGCTLFASFIYSKDQFWVFLLLRGCVGIGEASYSVVAPTIIADLFVKSKRTRMLSVFFFAIPIGSGLGYIVGSSAAQGFGSWHWALRITPGLGLITMILMMVIIPNPKRGASEVKTTCPGEALEEKSSYLDDLRYIIKNKSFMLVTIAFTCMAFVVGSLTIWGPIYVAYSQVVTGTLAPCTEDGCEYGNVSFIFGLITCLAGFLGVIVGAESAKFWRDRGQKNADALVSAIGLILAAPLLFAGFQTAESNLPLAWSCIFFADTAMCFTWTLVGDMTLYVTMPSRRATAQAVQVLTMHLFGDAGSPYLLGVLSDALIGEMDDTYFSKYLGLQRAMYVTLFAAVLGGGFFLLAALFVVGDKKKVDDKLAGKSPSNSVNTESTPLTDEESGTVIAQPWTERFPHEGGDAYLQCVSAGDVRAIDDGPYLDIGKTPTDPPTYEPALSAEEMPDVAIQPKRAVDWENERGSDHSSSSDSIACADARLLGIGSESNV